MKKFKGVVIAVKTPKTAKVRVDYHWQHPLYKKILRRSKKYLCHDEIGIKENDKVLIEECRPISKRKKFKIVKKL